MKAAPSRPRSIQGEQKSYCYLGHVMVIKSLLFKKGQNVEGQVFFTINKKIYNFCLISLKLSEIDLLMSWSNCESLSKIGKKLWISYYM